jgi:hypothetical protein
MLQGSGRHDNPLLYGCLYVSEQPVSAVVEQLQHLRGTILAPPDLVVAGRPVALAAIELDDGAAVVDLDEPRVLAGEGLRPSLVATRLRARTQADAASLFERRPEAAGLRWWSTFESQWLNVTLYDRADPSLSVGRIAVLEVHDEIVEEAAAFLGLRIST